MGFICIHGLRYTDRDLTNMSCEFALAKQFRLHRFEKTEEVENNNDTQ